MHYQNEKCPKISVSNIEISGIFLNYIKMISEQKYLFSHRNSLHFEMLIKVHYLDNTNLRNFREKDISPKQICLFNTCTYCTVYIIYA